MSASRSPSGKNITFHLPRRSLMIAGIALRHVQIGANEHALAAQRLLVD